MSDIDNPDIIQAGLFKSETVWVTWTFPGWCHESWVVSPTLLPIVVSPTHVKCHPTWLTDWRIPWHPGYQYTINISAGNYATPRALRATCRKGWTFSRLDGRLPGCTAEMLMSWGGKLMAADATKALEGCSGCYRDWGHQPIIVALGGKDVIQQPVYPTCHPELPVTSHQRHTMICKETIPKRLITPYVSTIKHHRHKWEKCHFVAFFSLIPVMFIFVDFS